jgi:hypothetical protein
MPYGDQARIARIGVPELDLADEQIDHIAEQLDGLLDSPAMADVKKVLSDLEARLGGRYGISLNCVLDIFDRDTELQREHALPVLTTGLATDEKG